MIRDRNHHFYGGGNVVGELNATNSSLEVEDGRKLHNHLMGFGINGKLTIKGALGGNASASTTAPNFDNLGAVWAFLDNDRIVLESTIRLTDIPGAKWLIKGRHATMEFNGAAGLMGDLESISFDAGKDGGFVINQTVQPCGMYVRLNGRLVGATGKYLQAAVILEHPNCTGLGKTEVVGCANGVLQVSAGTYDGASCDGAGTLP